YGASKLAGERAAEAAGLPLAIVRPAAIYGPRDALALPLFRMAARGLRPTGPRTVNFVHVRDVVEALVIAADHPGAAGGVFHAAADDMTLADLGRGLSLAAGCRFSVPLRLPDALFRVSAWAAEGLARVLRRPPALDRQQAR